MINSESMGESGPLKLSFSTEVAEALAAYARSDGRRAPAYLGERDEDCCLFGFEREPLDYAVICTVFTSVGDSASVTAASCALPAGVRLLGRAIAPNPLLPPLNADSPDAGDVPHTSVINALTAVMISVRLTTDGLQGCTIKAKFAAGGHLPVAGYVVEPMSVIAANTVLLVTEHREIMSLLLTENVDRDDLTEWIDQKFANVKERIASRKSFFRPLRPTLDVLLPSIEKEEDECVLGHSLTTDSTLRDLWRLADELNTGEKPKQHTLTFQKNVISFEQRRMVGSDRSEFENEEIPVPILHIRRGEYTVVKVPLQLQGLVVCSDSQLLSSVGSLLSLSLIRQLRLARRCLLANANFKRKKFEAVKAYSFYPPRGGIFITTNYSPKKADDKLAEERRKWHVLFNLPLDRPLLRRANAHPLGRPSGPLLRNVHEYAKPSGIENGETAMVEGNYHYHHYMQDGVDDNGWGCAYRSFQTLWSWYQLQAHTELPVPTHRQIQQVLVDIKDKPVSFVGSRQWVGSLELGWCLEHMLGFESRISRADSGADMADKVRELLVHFQTEGTPVMIGGGVLAHTILGVALDAADTGEVKFLVLDPHYTGEENVRSIIKGGWCAWKPVSFWKSDSFYNMLLPKRPRAI